MTGKTLIRPDAVFDDGVLHQDCALILEGGVVQMITPAPPDARGVAGIVAPGFVDLQVNGGGGVLVNTDPTVAGLRRIAAAHRAFGTVAILPTVITDAPQVLAAAAAAVMAQDGADGILGLHIEGPHIALEKRGTHAAEHIRPMETATMEIVVSLRAAGHVVMITVAPEACAPAQIAELAATGAVVSIGHSACDTATLDAALAAGATCGTHLFNAMSQMTARAPGVVGGLLDAGAYAGLICDGHHVDDRMLGLALRAHRRPERLFLVSDAMATVGGPDHFTLYGQQIRLQDGRLVNADGHLAGAHLTQAAGVAHLLHRIGLGPAQALHMVTSAPATLIGKPALAHVNGRAIADLVVMDPKAQVSPLAQHLP